MPTLCEVLDFTKVLKRKMQCINCKNSFTYTMAEFFKFTKLCPYCKQINKLELETSEEYYE